MSAIHLTKGGYLRRVNDFESNGNEWKFKGDKPILIDFFATWCGPCKNLSPIIDELAKEYEGKVDIYKVDVDQEEELAAQFDIRSIPTLVFASTDLEPQVTVGAMPKSALKDALDQMLRSE